ncbi:hypothetical protein ACQRDU_10195, partial [Limosilactobacillus reuteri]
NADLKTAQGNYDAAANRQTVASDAYTKAETALNDAKAAQKKANDDLYQAEQDLQNADDYSVEYLTGARDAAQATADKADADVAA